MPVPVTDRQSVNPARLRFTWGASKEAPAPWRFGLLCFFRRAKSPVTGNYYVPRNATTSYPLAVLVNLRGLLFWLLVLSATGLFGGAAVLARWYGQKPFNRVTYADLALPWRWSRLEPLRGQANLAQAQDDLSRGNVASAFFHLRAGLARCPGDTTARLDLATIYILFRLRPEAEKTLLAAFDNSYPKYDYITRAISILEKGENPALMVDFCDRARSALEAFGPPSVRDARYLDGMKVKALLDLERFDEAVTFIEKNQPKDVGLLQMARISRALSRGDFVEAEHQLAVWLAAMPDFEDALVVAVRVYRVSGKVPEMQAAILRLRSRYPENPNHIALGISENLLVGQTQAALDLLDISVIRFADTPGVFGEWAEAVGKTGHTEVLARLEQLVSESNQSPQTVMLARLMTAIRVQAWAEAAECSARLEMSSPAMQPRLQAIHTVAKALLETCTQPVKGAQNTLTASISGGWVGLHLYRQIVDALSASERYEAALEVLTLAEGYYPASRYIASQRVAITAKLATRDAALALATAGNAPLAEVAPVFADASAFFAAFDVQVREGRASEAQRLVRAVRKDAPAWLQVALPELEWREIQLAAQVDDLSLLQLNLRTFLRSRPEAQANEVVTLASAWNVDGHRAAALIAVREVVRVCPEHKDALRLLVEWSPRQADGGAEAPNPSAPAAPGKAAVNTPLPGSAEELFAVLDAQAGATRNAESLRLLRAVRKAEPAWLGAVLPEVEWREILLAADADDLSLLQLNVRTYLRLRPTEIERCLEQARTWHGRDKKQAALLVVREILLQYPDQASAKKLLSEWSKP